ncbi:MAG TPA: protein kinase, partial [Polyangiaceae bacterium]|nr:protein kinase [Polyangiaceae bacterium]
MGVGYVVSSKYRLVRLLGDGGMGSVYEAVHEVLGTRVAIKLLHPELAGRSGLIDRFLQEAQVSAQIDSPHVVQVIDVDRTAEGQAYIVMELLQGEPLSGVLERDHRVPIPVACEYTRQILEALEAAHALNVTHRDLKPENVFVTFVAGKPVLKLIDFGIAKLRNSDSGAPKNLTVAGVVMGTAEYMAPEQALSADKADARSDIYSVGVMLYEMIAGVRPVEGDGNARLIAARVEQGEVKPLVHAAPEVPRELAGLVHRAMAARPELRFASASEMRIALENLSLAPDGVREPTKRIAAPSVGPGTVLGAPAEAVFSPAAATGVSGGTVLGARPEVQMPSPAMPPAILHAHHNGEPYPAGPARHAQQGGIAMAPYGPPAQGYRSAPRKRSGSMWLWLLLPLLLGVGGTIAYFVVASQEDSAAAPPPESPRATPPPPAVTPTESPAAQVPTPATATVEPLVSTTRPATPPRPTQGTRPPGKPSAAPSASGASSGGAVPFPSSPIPPITFPSGFPPLPSGFPT